MKSYRALVVSMWVAGCPNGGTPSKSDAADGTGPSDGTAGETTADGRGKTETTVGPDGKADAATDTAPKPDGAGPDAEPTDTAKPPGPDGLLGSPCVADTDCETDYNCLSGMCTRDCKDDQGQPIEGACSKLSEVSIAGGKWGCPNDVGWCLPGWVDGKNVKCSADIDCEALGTDLVCATAILFGNKVVDGVCIPAGDRKAVGSTCAERYECESLLCLGAQDGLGTCAAHCKQNANCPAQHLCVGLGFASGDSSVPVAYAGICAEVQGSLTYCKSQAVCPEGNVCEAFIEPASLGPVYWCVSEVPGGKPLGEKCEAAADCASARCMLGGQAAAGIEGYCVHTCQDAADCAADATMRCGALSLHPNTTADDPTDDPEYGLCVRGDTGEACGVDEPSWCEGDLWCKPADTLPKGIGSCEASVCGDQVENGAETDVDCGGETCPGCAADQSCWVATDCASNFCRKKAGKKTCAPCAAAPDCAGFDATAICKDGVCELPPPPPEPKWCVETCGKTEDCTEGFECETGACTAKSSSGGCAVDAECTALYSGWTTPCATDTDCLAGVCAEDAGGRCAFTPEGLGGSCSVIPGATEYQTQKKDGGGPVTVCANTNFACKNGACGCTSDASCAPAAPYCNAETGACTECEADAECAGKPKTKCVQGGCMGCASDTECKDGLSKCLPDLSCGCASDGECKAAQSGYADTCYEGICGCGSEATCTATKVNPGTTWQCQGTP
jgi:hypothetical protein